MPVKPIPDGYHSVTPYLIVKGAADALKFYHQAFGAKEIMRLPGPNACIGHAEMRVGDSCVMMADESPQMKAFSPQTLGGCAIHLLLYVEDVDTCFKQALAAGAREIRPIQDQFYGDRSGTLVDPFGHMWTVATHKEDLTHEEIAARSVEFSKKMQAAQKPN